MGMVLVSFQSASFEWQQLHSAVKACGRIPEVRRESSNEKKRLFANVLELWHKPFTETEISGSLSAMSNRTLRNVRWMLFLHFLALKEPIINPKGFESLLQ